MNNGRLQTIFRRPMGPASTQSRAHRAQKGNAMKQDSTEQSTPINKGRDWQAEVLRRAAPPMLEQLGDFFAPQKVSNAPTPPDTEAVAPGPAKKGGK